MDKLYGFILQVANKAIDSGKVPSFGCGADGQLDILRHPLVSGSTILDTYFSGDEVIAKGYLLQQGLCYIEVPQESYRDGEQTLSYDKFLATSNTNEIVSWLPEEDKSKLEEKKRKTESLKTHDGQFYVFKPYIKAKTLERKVTKPRTLLDLSDKDLRVYPVEVLTYLWNTIQEKLSKRYLELTYQKDNRIERILTSTLNRELLISTHRSEEKVDEMIEGTFRGTDLKELPSMNRGYLRILEADSSIFDTGVRALNIARVLKFREVSEVDTSYIHVNLGIVVDTCISYIYKIHQNSLYKAIDEFKDWFEDFNATNKTEIENWLRLRDTVDHTQFSKELHNFMISSPEIFHQYNGEEEEITVDLDKNTVDVDFDNLNLSDDILDLGL